MFIYIYIYTLHDFIGELFYHEEVFMILNLKEIDSFKYDKTNFHHNH